MPLLPLAITMGDPAGIGPELIAKFFALNDHNSPIFVIGDKQVIQQSLDLIHSKLKLKSIKSASQVLLEANSIHVMETSNLHQPVSYGNLKSEYGKVAYSAILVGIELALSKQISAMVTAPINKAAFNKAGIDFPGHTEILLKFSGVKQVAMMLANSDLRIVLVTSHEPLIKAIKNITRKRVRETILIAHQACLDLKIKHPRVAVAGLNPHAGESGLFGLEEVSVIRPAVEDALAMGIDVSGPLPGDTVFMQAREGKFDIVVAQYHDQGLIPVKYMGLHDGVNITLGLPFVRTSPDHGTAFDIAGQGIADIRSLKKAVQYAMELSK